MEISDCDDGGFPMFFFTTSYIEAEPADEPDSPPADELPAEGFLPALESPFALIVPFCPP